MSTLNNNFEIIVFENHDPYDGTSDIPADMVVEEFVRMCKIYVNPKFVPKEETSLSFSKMTAYYSERTGNDKPCMVLLVGTITEDMVTIIKNGIANLYIGRCEDCDKEIDLKYCVCYNCANK